MSFPCYRKYKDSGVEWLGEVPGHWEVKALKNVISRIESGVSVNAIDTPAAEGEIGVLKTSCVYRGWFDPAENKAVVPEEYERVACPVTAGTLIVSRMNTPDLVGAAGMVGESNPGLFLPDRLWQVHFADAHPAFIHYWTHSPLYRAQVQQVCAGASSSMQNLAQDQFRAFTLALPPVREQTAIATFLDRETAKIDALVAEQQNLIVLLKEKRQALISHAVTKGLDPDVPVKDSGVAWLGEVPAHWEVTRIKRLCELITDGAHISPETKGGVFPFVSTTNISDEGIDFVDCLLTSPSSYEYLVKTGCKPEKGDVLFSKDGTIGRTVVVRESRSFVVASSLIIIRPNADELSCDYMNYLCGSDIVTRQVESLVKGAGLPRLSIQNLLKVVGIFPPINEQIQIAKVLEQQTSSFDELIDEAERGIELLLERRTALISAAVTGKIDVRHLAAACAEPTPEPA